jgi:hypothetical protein
LATYPEYIAHRFAAVRPVFAVTTGRAGTRSLVTSLNEVGLIRAFHEPHPTLFHEGNRCHAEGHKIPPKYGSRLIWALRGIMVQRAHEMSMQYVEFTPGMAFMADSIMGKAGAFIDGRWIHLVRSPKDYVVSSINKGHWSQKNTLFPNLGLEEQGPHARAIRYWAATHRRGLALEKLYGTQRVKRVYCEELWRGDGKTFDDLTHWITGGHKMGYERNYGREITEDQNESPTGKTVSWNPDWDPILRREAGDLLGELYGK